MKVAFSGCFYIVDAWMDDFQAHSKGKPSLPLLWAWKWIYNIYKSKSRDFDLIAT